MSANGPVAPMAWPQASQGLQGGKRPREEVSTESGLQFTTFDCSPMDLNPKSPFMSLRSDQMTTSKLYQRGSTNVNKNIEFDSFIPSKVSADINFDTFTPEPIKKPANALLQPPNQPSLASSSKEGGTFQVLPAVVPLVSLRKKSTLLSGLDMEKKLSGKETPLGTQGPAFTDQPREIASSSTDAALLLPSKVDAKNKNFSVLETAQAKEDFQFIDEKPQNPHSLINIDENARSAALLNHSIMKNNVALSMTESSQGAIVSAGGQLDASIVSGSLPMTPRAMSRSSLSIRQDTALPLTRHPGNLETSGPVLAGKPTTIAPAATSLPENDRYNQVSIVSRSPPATSNGRTQEEIQMRMQWMDQDRPAEIQSFQASRTAAKQSEKEVMDTLENLLIDARKTFKAEIDFAVRMCSVRAQAVIQRRSKFNVPEWDQNNSTSLAMSNITEIPP